MAPVIRQNESRIATADGRYGFPSHCCTATRRYVMHPELSHDLLVFGAGELETLAEGLADDYASAQPWPHAVIDDFLPAHIAGNILDCFPGPDDPAWLDWKDRDTKHQPRKQGIGHAKKLEGVHPYIHHVLAAFMTSPFLTFLERLTGIGKLIPDPHLNGGGLHQILPQGHLSIHTDYNRLHDLDLYRRINVLYYLNRDWREEYGGNLELWDARGRTCVEEIAPLFNRLVVFNTDKRTPHGHASPLDVPEGVTRKSLAFYYYTAKPARGMRYNGRTDWFRPRKKP